ncbi:helix-turn-helix domain-containing protein [uncultured Veillonella sp.]|uniref:helix-turn-helix domain-containing protein n=1 Tax=uncultured Veillonella sp. TaxID=159268 RepID=UPI0034A07EE3
MIYVKFLRIGKNAAYKLINSGKLKSYCINRIWKIPRQSVEEYIDEARNSYFII